MGLTDEAQEQAIEHAIEETEMAQRKHRDLLERLHRIQADALALHAATNESKEYGEIRHWCDEALTKLWKLTVDAVDKDKKLDKRLYHQRKELATPAKAETG